MPSLEDEDSVFIVEHNDLRFKSFILDIEGIDNLRHIAEIDLVNVSFFIRDFIQNYVYEDMKIEDVNRYGPLITGLYQELSAKIRNTVYVHVLNIQDFIDCPFLLIDNYVILVFLH